MTKHTKTGNGLLISLGVILGTLILAILLFIFLQQKREERAPQTQSTEIRTKISTTVPPTTPTLANLTEVTETVETSKVEKDENPVGWPEVTANDGRDTCARAYEKNGIPLVNRLHPVNWDFIPPVENRDGVLLQPVALDAYFAMRQAANAEGIDFYFRSGYRNFANQVAIYNQYLRTDPGGKASVDRYSAPPGASEHQTGLAVDIDNGNGLSTEFDQTPAGQWLHENAYKFGFIIRFPKGKEHITGYQYEPWHFRYVGVEIASQFGPHNTLSLEEFLGAEAAPAP